MSKIVGIDEAGRGPWAGPVVAAAVILDPFKKIDGLKDSKQTSEKERERLYREIMANALDAQVFAVSSLIIDKINILQATFMAMRESLNLIRQQADIDLVLVDGNKKIPGISFKQEAIVKGDQKIESIMAASIVAKFHRDKLMLGFHDKYPHYGFARHKGYGTKFHQDALKEHGPCFIHRMSYAPLKKWGVLNESRLIF